MSYSLNLHLWFSPERGFGNGLFKEVMGCLSFSNRRLEPDAAPEQSYRFEVFDKPFSAVAAVETKSAEEVCSLVARYWDERRHISINSTFPYAQYDEGADAVRLSVRPLEIHLYGTEFGPYKYHHKRYGHLVFSFENVNAFLIPQTLIEKARLTAMAGDDAGKWLRLIALLSQNYQVVTELRRCLIKNVTPKHLVVCTESDVNPLVAHAIYHEDVQDFVDDLVIIARLHEYGGLYFCEVNADDPAFLSPWKTAPSYGYLRGELGDRSEEAFVKTIQPFVNMTLGNLNKIRLTKDDLIECFGTMYNTEVEEIRDGYLLSATNEPFGYIEEPYLALFEQVRSQI